MRPIRTKAARVRVVFTAMLWLAIGLAMMNASASASAPAKAFDLTLTHPRTAAHAPYEADCGPEWEVVSSANVNIHDHYLMAVDVVSSNDVWAVGQYIGDEQLFLTLTEHWNGSTWSVVPSPNPGTTNELKAVTAVSANDVWAVGNYYAGSGSQTLTVHWNGSTWSVVPSPNPGTTNELRAVTAVSANDVWAVGHFENEGEYQTLVAHWNGSTWSVVPSPNPGTTYNFLYGVDALSPTDVWAVGEYELGSVYFTLIEHWDGTSWSVVPSANPGTSSNSLRGVSAKSANDIWAVGLYHNLGEVDRTLVEHWNGSTWSVIESPNVGTYGSSLWGVTSISAEDVWAVGNYLNGSGYQTLVEHWDGSTWSVWSSPNPSTTFSGLRGVAYANAGDVWAVGDYAGDFGKQTLVERYNPCPTTPTPQSTQTPGGPTATPVPPSNTPANTPPATNTRTTTRTPTAGASTATPTSTPTACPLQFSDVPPGSAFYTFVRCLGCRGVVSGYPNGNFGPNDPVTRGQLSKIVSNSAGYIDNHTTQHFQDVGVGSTFHLFIARLYTRGHISGYPCNQLPSEPCVAPNNLPYFRPNANVTRGQTSKIAASARALPPPPAGQWTFQDAPPGSTFWQWIEALAANGAISGYGCGNPEACVPPKNRPYFRPGNNVTRGQSAKIVANAFFPGCQTP